MLWSMLFYSILMLAINWDDIATKVMGRNTTIVTNNVPLQQSPAIDAPESVPAKISGSGIIENISSVVRIVNGW